MNEVMYHLISRQFFVKKAYYQLLSYDVNLYPSFEIQSYPQSLNVRQHSGEFLVEVMMLLFLHLKDVVESVDF